MNPKLNKKVKKFLDAYFKGTSASSPEAHHAIMFILKGALTDANFHSTSKKVDKLFPKAKNAKYFGKREWEDNLESKGADIATMAKWDGHDILDSIGFFVSMYVGGPLGKKIEALKNESLNKESKLLENLSVLVEKNVPTNPSKWSYYKAQAKKKFDVYPSAYANAWAAKQYKAAGGGWRTTKEVVVPEEDTVAEKVSVFDERPIGKKGIIIMIDDGGKKVSAIFKDKKNADKFNRNNPSDIKKLLQLAKGKKFPQTIDESVNENFTKEQSYNGLFKFKYKGKKLVGKVLRNDGGKYTLGLTDFGLFSVPNIPQKDMEYLGNAYDQGKKGLPYLSAHPKNFKKVEKDEFHARLVFKGGVTVGLSNYLSNSTLKDINKEYRLKLTKDDLKGKSANEKVESVINEISAEGGLKRVIKGQTREVEGIKLSVPMAQAMLDWFNSSPYGRKYPRAKKARLHLSLGIMMGFGLDRYAKHKGAKEELKYIKTLAKAMREDNTLRESTIKHLKSLNEEKITDKELKDALRSRPYDIQVLSRFMMDKVKNFNGLGYPGYNTYKLNFKSPVQGLKVNAKDDGKRKEHMISGKELKTLIPTILKKSGKVNLVYKITKQSVFKPGMMIGGQGYWIVK